MHKEADLQFVSARVRVTKKKIDELYGETQNQNKIIQCEWKHGAGTRFMSNEKPLNLWFRNERNRKQRNSAEKKTLSLALHNLRRPQTSATRLNYAMG